MERAPMTPAGERALREELHRLKNVERPAIINEISVAREHGDLKENAEYHAAREKQSFVEGRILDIEARLAVAQVIDPAQLDADGRIVFGATVVLVDKKGGKKISYQIVGEDEADAKKGRVSYKTPLAKALLGKTAGETVSVSTPGGDQSYKIKSVDYPRS